MEIARILSQERGGRVSSLTVTVRKYRLERKIPNADKAAVAASAPQIPSCCGLPSPAAKSSGGTLTKGHIARIPVGQAGLAEHRMLEEDRVRIVGFDLDRRADQPLLHSARGRARSAGSAIPSACFRRST